MPDTSVTAHRSAGAVLAILLSACASQPEQSPPLKAHDQRIELSGTPFFPQKRYQCGPAALATVLSASGADVDPKDLVDRVYVPARRGSLQVEMLAAARAASRVPYGLDNGLDGIVAELEAGRPVLVLQNLGVGWLPRWHYAVVIGVDTARGEVILRSGTEARRRTAIGTFTRTWRRSDYWASVVLEPGELPANPDPGLYARALADMEAVGRFAVADAGWQSAIETWPDDTAILFGHANATMRAGKLSEAERLYRRVLAIDDSHWGTWNNLAYTLHARGRSQEALDLLASAIARLHDDGAGLSVLEASLREIEDAVSH